MWSANKGAFFAVEIQSPIFFLQAFVFRFAVSLVNQASD
jgi:hypothetical protein